MNDFLADVDKVNERNITSQEVTGDIVNGKSRIEAKKKVRQRYMDLLKGAKNMKEILEIQKEINGIQEDIKTVSGRVNYLSHASAMSTICLTFCQVLNPTASITQQPDFLAKLKTSFSRGLHWMGECLVVIIAIWPLWLLAFLIYVFF
ncbi:MAG: hypothetical protein C4329_06745 [Chitinophagaceae bacterium]